MAKAETAATTTDPAGEDQGIEMAGTLSVKNLTPPGLLEEVKGLPKGNREPIKLGFIHGKVRGLSVRSNAYDTKPAVALVGTFEGLRLDGSLIRSDACFLPSKVHNMIVSSVLGNERLPTEVAPKRGQKIDIMNLNEIEVVVAIEVVHDDSEVGYTYICKLRGEDPFTHSDPLEHTRKYIPGSELKKGLPRATPPQIRQFFEKASEPAEPKTLSQRALTKRASSSGPVVHEAATSQRHGETPAGASGKRRRGKKAA
jgi:hypothetical protein